MVGQSAVATAVPARHGRSGGLPRRHRSTLVPALGLCAWACLVAAMTATQWRLDAAGQGFTLPARGAGTKPRGLARQAVAASTSGAQGSSEVEAQWSSDAVGRRGAALAGALLASTRSLPAALAESAGAGAEAVSRAKLQRLLVNVGDAESLEKELKFWTQACDMRVLQDAVGEDGLRAVTLGFGSGSQRDGGSFALEVKLDPAVLKRPRPKLLNYDVLQPTVDALNFVQVGARGKIMEIFGRVQNAGGASLIGDASYMDVESPRGVPVRMVPRQGTPAVELVSFNIEVPAFEATSKFYKRALGLQELKYNDGDPPVQRLSAYLASDLGGPKLLLCPVPDGRLKDRRLDEFEGLLLLGPSAAEVAKAAEAAAALAEEERAQKEEKLRAKRQLAKKTGEAVPSLQKFLAETRAKPSVQLLGSAARIDDGLGNILLVADQSNFER